MPELPDQLKNLTNGKGNTMATFAEVAPRISQIKTEEEIKTDFAPKSPAAGGGEPEMTPAKMEAAYEKLKDIEANNGYVSIAHVVGLSPRQVKDLHQEVQKAYRFAVVEKVAEPIEEPVV